MVLKCLTQSRVDYKEQYEVLKDSGIRWNWNAPFPGWHFMGRMASQALFGSEHELKYLSAFVDSCTRKEYVMFSTKKFLKGELAALDALEVNLGWPPGQRPELFFLKAMWKPARAQITLRIQNGKYNLAILDREFSFQV